MSCEPYCPEIHNASDSEDSDYNVESISSEENKNATKLQKLKTNMLIILILRNLIQRDLRT